MTLARWQATITDEAGNIVASPQVEVRAEIAGAPLARLYSDRAGTVPAANPIPGDANGYVYFHVTGGAYRITASKGGFSREWRYVGIGRNAESDLSGLRPQGEWAAEISYSGSDYIRHNGRTFVSRVDENEGNEPPDAPEDSEVWMWVPLGENAELAIEAREEAEAQASYAEEWAASPSPISVPAGGNGTTDKSAKTLAGEAASDRVAVSTDLTAVALLKAQTEAAAEASGNVLLYDTKAAANAALAGLSNGQVVEVFADETQNGTRTRYRVETGAYVLKLNLSLPVQRIEVGSERSYRFGQSFSSIDSTVTGSWVFDGMASFPNKLGVNNTKPVTDPATGARTNDTAYVAGAADVAAIISGYDNVNNALAGLIASQHSIIYSGADHAAIFGGSLLTVGLDAVYSSMLGGTSNTVGEDCDYGVIIGGDQNQLLAGASDTASGFRGSIIGATSSDVQARNGIVLGGNGAHIAIGGTYGTLLNAELSTISGNHSVAYGNSVTVSAAYSFAGGTSISVAGARSFAIGDSHTIASGHDYSSAFGTGGVTPFTGAHVFASRHRGSTAGRNQALSFQCSQETTDASTLRLSLAGSASYPSQPASSVVSGRVYVDAVKDDGTCSSFVIEFTSERIGTGTPTLRKNTTTTQYNGLALGTVPTMNVTTGGIYRVQIVGIAATNIRWNARFDGIQTLY